MIEKLTFNCDFIKNFCSEHPDEQNLKLANLTDELFKSGIRLYERANESAAKNLNVNNGHMTFVNVITSFSNLIVNQLKTRNQIDPDILNVFKPINGYRDWLNFCDQILDLEQNDGLLNKKLCFSSKNFYDMIHQDEDGLRALFSVYNSFWLEDEMQKLLKFLVFAIACCNRLPFTLNCLWSSKNVGLTYVKSMKNANLDFPFSFWQLTEGMLLSRFLNLYSNRNIPVNSVTLQVPKQSRFRLDYKGNLFDFDTMNQVELDAYMNDHIEQERQRSPGKRHRNGKTIRCRYSYINGEEKMRESLRMIRKKGDKLVENFESLKYKTVRLRTNSAKNGGNNLTDKLNDSSPINPERIVCVFVHGGGSFSGGSVSYEAFSLRKICNELGGIPILSIDYSLSCPYPVQIQEILDVYLWLLSGKEEVKKIFGFNPQKIVLSGDSIGGNFILILTCVLNELNKLKDKTKFEIRLPSSLVAFYPAYSVVHATPSKCLLSIECLIELHLTLLIHSIFGANIWSNGDFKKIENSELYQRVANENKNLDNGFTSNNHHYARKSEDDSLPWFLCDYPTYRNRAQYIDTFYNHPLITPTLYSDKFSELSSIDMYLCVGEKDFLLDDTIEMAKQWKGNVCLDTLSEVSHAFLVFQHVSKRNLEATSLAIRRLQEACGLL